MEKNNILITGGAGFIGSNLAKKLLILYPKINITILDNFFTGQVENIFSIINNITLVTGNTWDISTLFPTQHFDIVFHFGEYSRIVTSFDNIDYLTKTNLYGTIQVLEMCRKWNAKIIYSASSSKLGNGGKDENISPYAWVKSKIVELIKNYNNWYNLQYEICYFFNVYGQGQIMSGEYATVIGIFTRQYKKNEILTVVSPGTQTRDFTHVDDIIDGVIKSSSKNMNKEWYLRTGENISIIDIANMFDSKWELVPERKGERFNSVYFPTDTQKILNWKPKWSINKWIEQIKNK